MEMPPEAAAPSVLIGRAAPQAEKQSVALRQDVLEGLPRVRADASRIGQVLNNLLSNVLRHTPEGAAVLLTAEAAEVRFCVEDTGEGMPPEHLPEIFGKFVQVDSERSVGGSGLGLAICKEIIEAHGGRITADSTPGEGAAFTFTLPAAEEKAA